MQGNVRGRELQAAAQDEAAVQGDAILQDSVRRRLSRGPRRPTRAYAVPAPGPEELLRFQLTLSHFLPAIRNVSSSSF